MTGTPYFISVILTAEEAILDISINQALLEFTGDMADASNVGTASPTAVSTNSAQRIDRPLPERWTPGNPQTKEYYYDQPYHSGFPPDGMDLSDYWTVRVIKGDVPTKERSKRWPAVFSSKWLSSTYQNKGSPSKQYGVPNGKCFYDVIFGTYEMHGTEGNLARYDRNMNWVKTSKNTIKKGRWWWQGPKTAATTF